MIFASLKEIRPHEKRIAVTPEIVQKIVQWGHDFLIEKNAGKESGFSDEMFEKAGAKIMDNPKKIYAQADVVFKIWGPTREEEKYLQQDQIIIAHFEAQNNAEQIERLKKIGVKCFALELLPRISRAQSMDILSSQSNLAGYKAVINAVFYQDKVVPMMMTAAGTVPPLKFLILGVGVAGLQAIATAKRLGGIVYAQDVRKEVKEQVESLGGRFLELKNEENFADKTGYATETSVEYQKKQKDLLLSQLKQSDVVITTAQIPGKKAPLLIDKEMLQSLSQPIVIMDMAASSGGNVEGSKDNEWVSIGSAKICGCSNLVAELAPSASKLFAQNVFNFVQKAYDLQTHELIFDANDEIFAKTNITQNI